MSYQELIEEIESGAVTPRTHKGVDVYEQLCRSFVIEQSQTHVKDFLHMLDIIHSKNFLVYDPRNYTCGMLKYHVPETGSVDIVRWFATHGLYPDDTLLGFCIQFHGLDFYLKVIIDDYFRNVMGLGPNDHPNALKKIHTRRDWFKDFKRAFSMRLEFPVDFITERVRKIKDIATEIIYDAPELDDCSAQLIGKRRIPADAKKLFSAEYYTMQGLTDTPEYKLSVNKRQKMYAGLLEDIVQMTRFFGLDSTRVDTIPEPDHGTDVFELYLDLFVKSTERIGSEQECKVFEIFKSDFSKSLLSKFITSCESNILICESPQATLRNKYTEFKNKVYHELLTSDSFISRSILPKDIILYVILDYL